MKKLFIVVLSVILAVSAVVFIKSQKEVETPFLHENLKALSQSEGAHIICSKTCCGRCFEEKKSFPYYRCIWTGVQADFCECDKIGWIFV